MIGYENMELQWPTEQPTLQHSLKEQMTLVKGWTQLVIRYSAEEWPRHEQDIRKGLTRLDAATTQLTELLNQVLSSSSQ